METVQVMRHKSFLDSSLRLDGITAILNTVDGELLFYTEIYHKSNIRFKKSFIKYLNYCKEKGFIIGTPGINQRASRGQNQKVVYYTITEKGLKFLELVQ